VAQRLLTQLGHEVPAQPPIPSVFDRENPGEYRIVMERTGKNAGSFPRVSPPGHPYRVDLDSLSKAHPALLRRAAGPAASGQAIISSNTIGI
jgi:hypothetical protein